MNIKHAIKEMDRLIDTFKVNRSAQASEARLSEFERGQLDGLRWAKQALKMLQEEKNPPSD